MKKNILYFLALLLSFSAFSQKQQKVFSRYEDDSKWFIGLNAGAIWQTTDVKNKTQVGWGFLIGRSFLYNYGTPISFDVRARFLRGLWMGQDTRLTKVSPNDPAFNGSMGAYTNYLDSAKGMTLRNFQADVYEGSLELAMHINALRERTGLDIYVFGGIGLVWHQTFGNLYFVDSTGKKIYDYPSLSSYSKSASKGYLDNSFDTPLQGSYGGKRYNLDIMPSLGIGIGYQLTPMLQIGIEHKTTFTRGDLFDGKNYDDNLNPSKTKDMYHYTSLYLKINIKKAKSKRTYHPDPNTNPIDSNNTSHSGPVTPPPCNKPSITITDPRANYTSTADRFLLQANIYGISSAAELVFKQNGLSNNNFNYNPQNNGFQSEVILQPGSNIFEIIATNSCGQQTASRVIEFQRQVPNPPVVYPPVVTYQNPAVSPTTVSTIVFPLQAQVLNVAQSNQIVMQVNGLNHAFTYNPSTRTVTASLQLVEGANTVVTTATNTAGSDSKSTVIVYRQPATTPPPVVSFVQPNQNPQTVSNNQTTVLASVLNVENKSGITLTINGQIWNNFTFDKNTKIVRFDMSLQVGANVVNIKAQNESGQDEAATTLIYKRAETPKPPVVQFTQPNTNPCTVYTPTYQVEALVENVVDAQHIEVKINSVSTTNFSFNASSQTLTLLTTLLNGANTISIRGVNQDGEDSKSTVIVYRGVQTNHLPTVDITSPASNPAVVSVTNVPVKATVEYVSQMSQIKVYVNTVEISSFYYNNSTHTVDFTANLQLGDNTVRVVANNIAGQAEDSQVVSYQPVVVRKPPLIQFTQPVQSGMTIQNSDYTFMANVLEIDQKSQLELHFNGVAISAQSFTFSAGKITFFTPLIEGNNLLEIRATNEAGADAKSTSVLYQKRQAPCNPPSLAWISPSSSLVQTNDSLLPITVQTQNVHVLSEIDLVVNGHSATGLALDTTTGKATATVHLSQGINTISLVVHTACGKTLINKSISYIKPTQPCTLPIVNAVKPNALYITSQNTRFNFLASVAGVADTNQISVKLNGVSVPFSFHLAELMVDGIVNLVSGQNTLTVTVSNSCGSNALTWQLNVPPCNKPSFTFGHSAGVTSTTSSLYTFDGLTSDVSTSSNISLTLNGSPHNFNFNGTTGALSSVFNLAEGMNTIQLNLTNSCGQTSFSHQITYQAPVQVSPPYVQITLPANSPSSSTTPTTELKALVQNVTSPQNIRVLVNGVATLFSYANGQVSASVYLKTGANTLTVVATNTGGSDSDSRIVNFAERAPILAPVVAISSPSAASETTSASSYTVRGVVKNLASAQGLVVYVNGRVISASTVAGRDGLDFSFPVVFDNSHSSYAIKVVATNEAGKSEQEKSIVHNVPVAQPPHISNPGTSIHIEGTNSTPTPSGGRGGTTTINGGGTRSTEMNTRPTGQR